LATSLNVRSGSTVTTLRPLLRRMCSTVIQLPPEWRARRFGIAAAGRIEIAL
jgi:hypothetical protein